MSTSKPHGCHKSEQSLQAPFHFSNPENTNLLLIVVANVRVECVDAAYLNIYPALLSKFHCPKHSASAFCNWSSLSPPGLTQEIGDEYSLCKEAFFVTLGTTLPSTPVLGLPRHHLCRVLRRSFFSLLYSTKSKTQYSNLYKSYGSATGKNIARSAFRIYIFRDNVSFFG